MLRAFNSHTGTNLFLWRAEISVPQMHSQRDELLAAAAKSTNAMQDCISASARCFVQHLCRETRHRTQHKALCWPAWWNTMSQITQCTVTTQLWENLQLISGEEWKHCSHGEQQNIFHKMPSYVSRPFFLLHHPRVLALVFSLSLNSAQKSRSALIEIQTPIN